MRSPGPYDGKSDMKAGSTAIPSEHDNGGESWFQSALATRLLGVTVGFDIYLRNGFRIIGLPANASSSEIAKETNRLKTMAKIGGECVRGISIRNGYEGKLNPNAAVECASALKDPRFRFVCELFWPHLDEIGFEILKRCKDLNDAQLREHLESIAQGIGEQEAMLAKHALTIIHHNEALRGEIAAIEGTAMWNADPWRRAFRYWHETIQSNRYWEYMTERAKAYDDPRIAPDDVEHLRKAVEKAIVELNALLARLHVANGTGLAKEHIALLIGGPFARALVDEQLASTVRAMAKKQISMLSGMATRLLIDPKDRMRHKKFREQLDILWTHIEGAMRELKEDAGLSDDLLARAEFDEVGKIILSALSGSIDYMNERERAILLSIVTARRLMQLPISSGMRAKLESSIRQDISYLYKEFGSVDGVDPSECWFLEGEMADPEASILLPVFKISSVTGAQIQWYSKAVLVPRSVFARDCHQGKKPVALADRVSRSPRMMKAKKERESAQKMLDAETKQATERKKRARLEILTRYKARHDEISAQIEEKEKSNDKVLRELDAAASQKIARAKNQLESAEQDIESGRKSDRDLAFKTYEAACAEKRTATYFVRKDLPITILSGFGCGLLAFGLGSSAGFSAGIAGQPLYMHGALVGAILGLVRYPVSRGITTSRAKQRLGQIEMKIEKEKRAARAKANAAIGAIKNELQAKKNEMTEKIRLLEQQKEKNEAEAKAEIGLKEKEIEEQSARRKNEYARIIKEAEKMLAAYSEPKPTDAAKNHPMYKRARASGYKDGKRPPEDEAQRLMTAKAEAFMASLDYNERAKLIRLMQICGENEANKYLMKLMGMPRQEAKNALRSLPL